MTAAPVEGKVWGSVTGFSGGSVTAGLVLWLLGVTVWDKPMDAAHAADAVAAVPGPVALFVVAAIAGGSTFLGGWWAKHTPRPPVPGASPPGGELVSGADLSVVAAALAELRSIVATVHQTPMPAPAGDPPTPAAPSPDYTSPPTADGLDPFPLSTTSGAIP